MSVTQQHVDMPSEQSSLAVVQECIKKAGAMQAEIQASAAAAEQVARSQMSAEAEMMTEVVAEAVGLGGVKSAVDFVDQRIVDNPAKSHAAHQMVEKGLAENPTSFEGVHDTVDSAVSVIQTSFDGPSLSEQMNIASMGLDSLSTDTKGMKAEEEATAEMASVQECKAVMQLANEQVMAVGMQLVNSAPAPGGLGLTSGASIQDTQAAAYANRLGNAPQHEQPPTNWPTLAMDTRQPKGPSADILTEDNGEMVS